MEKKCICKILLLIIALLQSANIFSKDDSKNGASKKDEVTIVNIQKADRTGNRKSELDGTDMILLEGGVVVSVEKGDTTTVISADIINFNRAKDMLYAEGSVKLSQSSGNSGNESVTAQTLLFNTATLEGIFDGGRIVQTQSDSLNLPSGSTLIVASDIFGRDDSGTITFKNGALTFCDEDPPHWKIKASRIWLLPGDEFAFFNAFLYVGQVPVLYLPAFWYPKDELIFNPTFGYRQREGYFFQTTTYIYGRKPLSAYDVADKYSKSDSSSTSTDSDDDSYYSFVKPSKLKEQERQGLLLHNLPDDYTGNTSNYVKILADWYASLGYMFGVDGVLSPNKDYISKLNFNAEIGFSNTIFQNNEVYLPYGTSTGKVYNDSSNFLGIKLPYRYKANIEFAVNKPFNLSLSMPLYSDSYFTSDFDDRTETMDWIDYLMSNPNQSSDDETTDKVSISSFSWNLSGSYSATLPSFIKPYVSNFSISSFSSSIVFSNLTNSVIASDTSEDNWKTYTPEKQFFYPSQITPIKVSASISGTLFSIGQSSSSSSSSKSTKFEVPFTAPEIISNSKGNSQTKTTEQTEQSEQSTKETDPDQTDQTEQPTTKEPILPESALPSLAFSVPSLKSITDITYSLNYLISPTYTTEIAYSYTGLEKPEDFDWSRIRSTMISFKMPTTLTSKLSLKDSFLGLTDSLTFNPVYQTHPYISTDTEYGGYTESGIASIKKSDYASRKLDLTNTNSLVLKPFYYTDNFKNTGVSWNTTIKIIRTEFVGDADNPEWEYLTTDFTDEDSVTAHTFDLTLAANQMGDLFSQQLVLSTTLPPQVDEYTGTLSFAFPYTKLTFATGIKQVSSTDDSWEKKPFKQSFSVQFLNSKVKFTEDYVYNLQDDYQDTLKFSLSSFDFQASYTAKYTTGYDFDSDAGWIARSEKEFLPYSLSFAYAQSSKTYRYWKDRISWAPSISTSVVYDFLRPTNSYFKFVPSLSFKINDALDIKFSASTRNDVIYRYVEQYFGPSAEIGGEKNWFKDLIDSFRFDDEEKRKNSGFKIESFNVAVSHGLHDWDLSTEFKIEPRLITRTDGTKYYDYSPYFTISVVWRTMKGMKTKVVDNYGDWELNP